MTDVRLRSHDFEVRWRERDIGGHSTEGTYFDGEWKVWVMDQDGDATRLEVFHRGKKILSAYVDDYSGLPYHYEAAKVVALTALRFCQGRIMCLERRGGEDCGECAYCKRTAPETSVALKPSESASLHRTLAQSPRRLCNTCGKPTTEHVGFRCPVEDDDPDEEVQNMIDRDRE